MFRHLFNRSTVRRHEEPCFEAMENRLLLSVSAAEFNAIKAANPDLNLTKVKNYNIIEILAKDLSPANLQAAIDKAGTTRKNDLIVVRTTATQNTITFAAAADTITININAALWGSVTIVSYGTATLTIDGDDLARVMNISGSSSVVALAGLTITNGQTSGSGSGIYSRGTLVVTNSTFVTNKAKYGGGVYNDRGLMTVTNSTFTGNETTYEGGGIYNAYGTVTVANSTFTGNIATGNTDSGHCGGGIFNKGGSMTVSRSTFIENEAVWGGGIYNSGSGTLTVVSSIFARNTVTDHGGGLNNNSGTLTVVNSTIVGNTAGKDGGGIMCWDDTVILVNSIIVNNTATDGNDMYDEDATAIRGYNNLTSFTGWTAGSNPVYDDTLPLFVDAADGDYRLTADSQARDAGNTARAVAAGITPMSRDMSGNPRMAKTIDIGAYEYPLTTDNSMKTAKGTAAVKSSITTQGANLTWAAVAGADGYWVEWYVKDTFAGAMWVANNADALRQQAAITGLLPGVKYSIRVYTTAGDAISSKFAKASVKTRATPSPVSVKAKASSATQVLISWAAPKAAVPAEVTLAGYRIYNAGGVLIGTVGVDTTSFTVNALKPKTLYTFRVVAIYSPVGGGNTVESTKPVTVKAKTLAA